MNSFPQLEPDCGCSFMYEQVEEGKGNLNLPMLCEVNAEPTPSNCLLFQI